MLTDGKASPYTTVSRTLWPLPGRCTITSKINSTPKEVYLPILKVYSILAVSNLLAHNNLWLCYHGHVNSPRLKSNVALNWASKHLSGYHLFCWWWCAIDVNDQSAWESFKIENSIICIRNSLYIYTFNHYF